MTSWSRPGLCSAGCGTCPHGPGVYFLLALGMFPRLGYARVWAKLNRQLTVQESRHRLARVICHGKRGQIQQAYRDGQEDQLGCLGLVLNAAAL